MIAEVYAKTDIGRTRKNNEDNFLVLDLHTGRALTASEGSFPPEMKRLEVGPEGIVLAVSDGMGGALAGDIASRMAVESVRDRLATENRSERPLLERLREAVLYANLAIHRRSLNDPCCSGMGATFTGAAIKRGELGLIQIGDSRAYLIRGAQIKLLTRDQSLVQRLIDMGQITEEEARIHMFRNVILQALGAQREINPVTGKLKLREADTLLLCSDGLSNKLEAEELFDTLNRTTDLQAAGEALIERANQRGGEDNITLILARFTGDELKVAESNEITVEEETHFDEIPEELLKLL